MPEVEIKLSNNEFDFIHSGDDLKGVIELRIDEPISYKGLKIIVLGEASCKWNQKGCLQQEPVTFTSYENFFHHVGFVFGSEFGAAVEIKPGFHTFEFSCNLPADMPSSFMSDDGCVRYSVEAIFLSTRPQNYTFTKKLPVHVVANRDYNHNLLMRVPVSSEIVHSFCKVFWKSSPLVVSAALPRSCFVPSEVVPINIEINNKSGIAIKGITIALMEMIKLTSTDPKEIQKKGSCVILQDISEEAPKLESEVIQRFITLPLLRQVKYCKIIKVYYEIHVNVQMAAFYSFPTLILPFDVGKITQKVSEL